MCLHLSCSKLINFIINAIINSINGPDSDTEATSGLFMRSFLLDPGQTSQLRSLIWFVYDFLPKKNTTFSSSQPLRLWLKRLNDVLRGEWDSLHTSHGLALLNVSRNYQSIQDYAVGFTVLISIRSINIGRPLGFRLKYWQDWSHFFRIADVHAC